MQKRQYMIFAYIDKTACSMCEIDLGLSTLVLTKIKIKSCHVINESVVKPTTLCHLFELVQLLILEDDHVLQTDQHTAALALEFCQAKFKSVFDGERWDGSELGNQ